MLRAGKESVEDEPRSDRPSPSKAAENIERVRVLLAKDRQLIPGLITKEVDTSRDTVGAVIQ